MLLICWENITCRNVDGRAMVCLDLPFELFYISYIISEGRSCVSEKSCSEGRLGISCGYDAGNKRIFFNDLVTNHRHCSFHP